MRTFGYGPTTSRSACDNPWSTSIARTRAPGLGERDRQGPETRADLDDAIAFTDAGIGHDRAGEVRVGEEVLAPDLGRPDPVARREILQSERPRPSPRSPAEPDLADALGERGDPGERLVARGR